MNFAALVALLSLASGLVRADSITDLSEQFWRWRATEQPFTSDDIPRIARPSPLVIDWSASMVAERMRDLTRFEARWTALASSTDAARSLQIDYRLLGSAIARVRWELSIEPRWQRDPSFYIDQSLGAVFDLLLPPPPFDALRQHELIARLQRIPATLAAAKGNLTDMRRPFVQLAVDALDGIAARLRQSAQALGPHVDASTRKAVEKVIPSAITALEGYRTWLQGELPRTRTDTAIGRDNYVWFLRNVALMSHTPEQLLAISREEWARSVAFETYQLERLAGTPAAPLFATADAQIAAEAAAERRVRLFLTEHKILTVPDWLHHYRNLLLPAYLAPLEDLSETDDLTGPTRLDEDGTSYIKAPRADLGFFRLSTAQDPRSIIVHEGVPGHYFQLCLAWHHPDPIRRHYYDSGANEGIGFYAEEMMLQAGLFDDNPRTRATIYSFMRLRALRVEVDVKLALGEFTLQQAADYLERTVPMDKATALSEAALFSSTPGQAISYQIGKVQITDLLADARRAGGSAFSLLKFNDYVWANGNVPLSLQRWEMLGDASAVPSPSPAPSSP